MTKIDYLAFSTSSNVDFLRFESIQNIEVQSIDYEARCMGKSTLSENQGVVFV